MEKIDLTLDLDHSNPDNKNVFLTMCENSQVSQELPSSNEEMQYELRNADEILQYRFVNTNGNNSIVNHGVNASITNPTASVISTNDRNCDNNSNNSLSSSAISSPTLETSTSTQIVNNVSTGTAAETTLIYRPNNILPTQNCQVILINDLSIAATRPCLISPKTSTNMINDKQILLASSKKRDEKRRATHNEVERRRRDKINQWIFKLKDLLPEHDVYSNSSSSTTATTTTASSKSKSTTEHSKSAILIKACEHIKSIQEENERLQECLSVYDNLRAENIAFKEKLKKLQKENEQLKALLTTTTNIKMESDLDFDAAS